MIKFKIDKNSIILKGHAGFLQYGKDIVCASVSTILITHINLIMKFGLVEDIDYRIGEGDFYLKVKNHSKQLDIILQNIKDSLNDLSSQYPNNISED